MIKLVEVLEHDDTALVVVPDAGICRGRWHFVGTVYASRFPKASRYVSRFRVNLVPVFRKLAALFFHSLFSTPPPAEFHYAEKAWQPKEHGIGPIQSEEVNHCADGQHVRADSEQTLNIKKRL